MPISPFGYPLDLTGTAPSNEIVGEVIAFTSPETRSFVPAAGPFFVFNLSIQNSVTGELLAPKTDFMVEYLLPEPSMISGKEVAGIIRITNTDIPGVILHYHVIGGSVGNTVTMLQAYLADNPVGPINPVWGEIADAQVQYPPAAHLTDMATVFGLGPLVNVLEGIRKGIVSGDVAAWGAVYSFLNLRLSQEHQSIIQDVADLTRPVPLSPIEKKALMSLAGNTYGWGDYVPVPPVSGKVLVSSGPGRGDWVWGDFPANSTTVSGAVSSGFLYHLIPTISTDEHLRLRIREPGIEISGTFRGSGTMATLNTSGLTADVMYYVYAYWDGTAVQLAMNTAPYINVANKVLAYKTGDSSRTFVGLFYKAPTGVIYTRSFFDDQSQYSSFSIDSLSGNVAQHGAFRTMQYSADKTLAQNTLIYNTSVDSETLYVLAFDHEEIDIRTILNFKHDLPPPGGTVTGTANFDLVDRGLNTVLAEFYSSRMGAGFTGGISIMGRIKETTAIMTDTQAMVWKLSAKINTFTYALSLKRSGAFDGYMNTTDSDVYSYTTTDTVNHAGDRASELLSGLYIRGYKRILSPYV